MTAPTLFARTVETREMQARAEALLAALAIEDHKPGGIDHDQSKHGWRKANPDGPPGPAKKKLPAKKKATKKPVTKAPAEGPASEPESSPWWKKTPSESAPESQPFTPVKTPGSDEPWEPEPLWQPARKNPGDLTVDDAQALQDRMVSDDPWTDEQVVALETYTSNDYKRINAALRGGTPEAAEYARNRLVQKTIRDANAALRPLPERVQLYRNTSASAFGLDDWSLRSDLPKLVGKTFQERGFLSTSVDDAENLGEFGEVHIELSVPPGIRAAFVKSISLNDHENEMVLAPGTKIRVISVDPTTLSIRAEVIV